MVRSFYLAPRSAATVEACAAYRVEMEARARAAAAAGGAVTSDQAFALCEYMDLVDAGSMAGERALYRTATTKVTHFIIEFVGTELVDDLRTASFAAQTLYDIIVETLEPVEAVLAA